VAFWPEGCERVAQGQKSTHPRYSRRPTVILRGLQPEKTYHYRLILTDPYENTFDSKDAFGTLSFSTGPALPTRKPSATLKNPDRFLLRSPGRPVALRAEQGEIHLTYQAGTAKSTALLRSGELMLRQLYGRQIILQAGGGHCLAEYRFQPGRTYRIRLRYRNFPLTREVWLLAADGGEFLLCADNHLPWREMKLGDAVSFAQSARAGFVREAVLFSDSRVCSEAGCRIRPIFDTEAFEQANAAVKADTPAGE